MRRLAVFLGIFVAVILGLAGVGSWWVWGYLSTPAGGDETAVIVVEHGATLKPVLDELSQRGVLEHPRWLYYYARISGSTEVRAGEYELTSKQTPLQILEDLQKGHVRMGSFTIPEGYNRWQVRDLLAEGHWVAKESFDRLCDDRELLAAQGIPGPSCDGYLFPDTYTFAVGTAPRTIFVTLFQGFRRVFEEVTRGGTGPRNLSMRELVTLASIVEKETGSAEERPHIACVFYNRLAARPRWKLQTDPTVIYAATLADPAFDGNLTERHLRELDSPYNTYRVFGLPPGPIANPGRAALQAVVQPVECDDFFFVSMNNGRHVFCPTLACHNRAVQKWQVNYFGHHGRPR